MKRKVGKYRSSIKPMPLKSDGNSLAKIDISWWNYLALASGTFVFLT